RAQRGPSIRRTKEWNDEESRCSRRGDRRRTLLVDLEDYRALIRAHDAQVGGDRYRQRTIAHADRKEIDAVPAPDLSQRRREPRCRERQRPRRHRKTLCE